ncbi:MAG: IS3 family transposase, partial [Turicibacter sp.]
VQLSLNGKRKCDIVREYDISSSLLDKWIKQANSTGSFKEKDNRTDEESELIRLHKQIKQLEMENDIFKASSADLRTKINVIKNNTHKYSVSAMCKVLNISRSTYYYEAKPRPRQQETQLVADVMELFRRSQNNYGTRKIRHELKLMGQQVSRRRIGRIMRQEGLVSNYTVAQYKPHVAKCNEEKIENIVARKFNNQPYLNVVVSDLTYVRVGNRWHYICVLLDLFNREIIGYSCGPNKDAELVKKAFSTVQNNLGEIKIFHTDRGNEFKNQAIDELLKTFKIERSLSMKGCPYDNAVAEATYKVIKTEFIYNKTFENQEQLGYELADYVNWYNNIRIHSSLGYLSPVAYRQNTLKKVV